MGTGLRFYFVLTCVLAGQQDDLKCGQQSSLFLLEAAKPQVSDVWMFSGALQIVSRSAWGLGSSPSTLNAAFLKSCPASAPNLKKSYLEAT